MNIKKSLPNTNYTKIDNRLIRDQGITEGAKVLYCFLVSLPNGKGINTKYISKSLQLSIKTVQRRLRELKNTGLVLTIQVYPRVFDLYIGYFDKSAKEVKEVWDKEV